VRVVRLQTVSPLVPQSGGSLLTTGAEVAASPFSSHAGGFDIGSASILTSAVKVCKTAPIWTPPLGGGPAVVGGGVAGGWCGGVW